MVNSLSGISNINNSNSSIGMGTNGVKVTKKKKPQKPRGRLIGKTEWVGPRCLARDIKAIGKGLTGQANDYELGKQNDLAMAVGSYGLAAYLSTKSKTTKGKIMEFVGATVFLGMMKLWPKVAIQYPIEARYGVNYRQKFEDSYGRIKEFYQDSQYTPWDLYSQQEYDKMAKKMGIPANTKNKNEKVQERAHDIALQANTWWMLTAGPASGIGTALLCNRLELPVQALAEFIDFESAQSQLKNLKLKEVTKDYKPHNTKNLKSIKTLLDSGKPLTQESIGKLAEMLILVGKDEKADTTAIEAMKKQIKSLLSKEFDAKDTFDYFKNPPKTAVFNNYKLSELITSYNIDLSKINCDSIKSSEDFLDALKNAAKDKDFVINGKNIDDTFAPILKQLEPKFDKYKIDNEFKSNIYDLYNRIDAVRVNQKKLYDFFQNTVGKVEGSIISNKANKFSDTFIKALGIKGKDLVKASTNDEAAREIVTKYLQEAAKDEKKYKKAIQALGSIQEELLGMLSDKLYDTYQDKVEEGIKVFGKDKKFSIIEQHFLGSQSLNGSQLKVYQSQYHRLIEGIQAYFAKPIMALDVFRRIETGLLEKQWSNIQKNDPNLKNVKYEDIKDIIISMFTKNDKVSSYTTKHGINNKSLYKAIYSLVYPTMTDSSTLEKIAKGVKENVNGVEQTCKSNLSVYTAMLSEDTKNVFNDKNSILQLLSDLSAKINFWLGSGEDPLHPECITHTKYSAQINGNIFSKDDLVSQSHERFLSDAAKRKHNTKIWAGVMIGGAIATVTATIIGLLTIGRTSKSNSKNKQNNHNNQHSPKGVVA